MSQVIENCGLEALKQIIEIKNISMYTLIQIAKDNGLNLYLSKVELKDLPLVKRPAIFHAEDHFVHIAENEPLSPERYTGWVLSHKPFGVPLPHSLAKQIKGSKKKKWGKGGNFLGPIITGIASVVNPFLGAAVGAGFAAHKVTGGAGVTPAKGEFWRIPIGGVLGGLGGLAPGSQAIPGISNAVLAGGLGAAQELPGAIATGNYMAPLVGGIGAGIGQKATSTLSGGFHAPASSVGERLLNTGGSLFGRTPTNAGVSGITPPTGNQLLSQSGGASQLATRGIQAPSTTPGGFAGPLSSTTQNVLNQGQQGAGGLASLFGGTKGDLLRIGGSALIGGIMKPPELGANPQEQYDKAARFLEGRTLPSATNQQLNKYLAMGIPDIQKEILGPPEANRSMLELDKQYQEALADVQRRAAASGQSIDTSSDARKQYDEINRQWATAKSNLWGDLEAKARQDAISIHTWALQQSIAQGQFDVNSAMKLAEMSGQDQQLRYAIESGNYEQFQDIVAHLLQMTDPNYQNNKNQSSQMAMAGAPAGGLQISWNPGYTGPQLKA